MAARAAVARVHSGREGGHCAGAALEDRPRELVDGGVVGEGEQRFATGLVTKSGWCGWWQKQPEKQAESPEAQRVLTKAAAPSLLLRRRTGRPCGQARPASIIQQRAGSVLGQPGRRARPFTRRDASDLAVHLWCCAAKSMRLRSGSWCSSALVLLVLLVQPLEARQGDRANVGG